MVASRLVGGEMTVNRWRQGGEGRTLVCNQMSSISICRRKTGTRLFSLILFKTVFVIEP